MEMQQLRDKLANQRKLADELDKELSQAERLSALFEGVASHRKGRYYQYDNKYIIVPVRKSIDDPIRTTVSIEPSLWEQLLTMKSRQFLVSFVREINLSWSPAMDETRSEYVSRNLLDLLVKEIKRLT